MYWKKYDGDRKKILHNIKLFDGTVIKGSYPNGNGWHTWIVCEANKNARKRYDDSEVEFIHELGGLGQVAMRYSSIRKILEEKGRCNEPKKDG